MGIELYLQGLTIKVHGVDYSVGRLHEDLDGVLYRRDSLLIGSGQRGSNAPIWQDSEWSKECFTLIRFALDLGIEGLLHYRIIQQSRTIQWHILDPVEVCRDCGDPQ